MSSTLNTTFNICWGCNAPTAVMAHPSAVSCTWLVLVQYIMDHKHDTTFIEECFVMQRWLTWPDETLNCIHWPTTIFSRQSLLQGDTITIGDALSDGSCWWWSTTADRLSLSKRFLHFFIDLFCTFNLSAVWYPGQLRYHEDGQVVVVTQVQVTKWDNIVTIRRRRRSG